MVRREKLRLRIRARPPRTAQGSAPRLRAAAGGIRSWRNLRTEEMMAEITLLEVIVEAKRIAQIADDDESAHSAEDGLHTSVLNYYANGGKDSELAREALKTLNLNFARWCA